MKNIITTFAITLQLISFSVTANEAQELFDNYYSSIIVVGEGRLNSNQGEIANTILPLIGIDGKITDNDGSKGISLVEAFLRSDYIFLGNIKSDDSNYNIQTYEEILYHFEKRKSLSIVKRISKQLRGNFNHLASPRIYEGAGFEMNNREYIHPFKNFNQHSLVATALYSCDAELTEFLMKKGADNVSKGLPDTFAFFKTYDQFSGHTRSGEAVYNHHRVVTPFNNFMSCLSLNGYWQGSEWVNYPEGNPIQPYMEAFVKKMIAHYLNKPELDLNEFGCYPVIKDYAYENFEWVRKMFTDKFGSDFAERCEANYQAWEDSCKSVDLPNGGRATRCSLRKY